MASPTPFPFEETCTAGEGEEDCDRFDVDATLEAGMLFKLIFVLLLDPVPPAPAPAPPTPQAPVMARFIAVKSIRQLADFQDSEDS